MFIKLASSLSGLVFAFLGFVSMFFLNLIGKKGALSALMGGFFGSLGFFAVWCLFVVALTTVFSDADLEKIFFISHRQIDETHENTEVTEYSLEDDQELTADDLYNSGNETESSSYQSADILSGLGGPSLGSDFNPTNTNELPENVASGLNSSGEFNLHSGQRVVRTNVKEAAQAARKVLMNDKT